MQKTIVACLTFGLTVGLASRASAESEAPHGDPPDAVAERKRKSERRELEHKIEIADLEARYAETLARARESRGSDAAWQPRAGAIVLPDLVGVNASYGVAMGAGSLGGLSISGPISAGHASSPLGFKTTYVAFTPSADVFVSDRVSVGGRLAVTRQTATNVSQSGTGESVVTTESESGGYSVGIAPRIGYALPLGKGVLLWPKFGVAVSRFRNEQNLSPRTLGASIGAELEVGLVLPLSRHVILQIAPVVGYAHTVVESRLPYGDGDAFDLGSRARLGIVF